MQVSKSALKILPGLLAFALCGGTAMADGHSTGQWYITPMITFVDDDTNRRVDDGFAGAQLGVGYAFNDAWMVEFNAYGANLDDQYLGRDQQTRGIGIDVLRSFKINDYFSPYGLIGIGYQDTSTNGGSDADDAVGSLALGVNTHLNTKGLALRTEARLRATEGSANLNDMYYSAGLRFPIGEKEPPPPPDADGDGVSDSNDRCPGTPAGTPVGPDGCELDGDGDGVVNSKDKCPNTPRGTKVDANGCKVVEKDSDGDGVPDSRDACPDTPRGAEVDDKGCELDGDGDGVVNSKDRCPNTRAGARIDVYGCEIKDKIELPGVQFELNSATLIPASTRVLSDAAQTLKNNPDINVEVAGHTDSTGAASYNQSLSQRRAEAVSQFLVDRGVAASRMSTRGYGEAEPIADNSTKEGRAMNRRVELKVAGGN